MRTDINSESVGDPTRFAALEELEQQLVRLQPDPRDHGTVRFLVRRVQGGQREFLDEVTLSPDLGVPGDSWGRHANRNRDAQIAVMQASVARLIANGQSPALFGDSLFLDFDLSRTNLPPGSELRIGEAVLDISPLPHNGCVKFKARFGQDALRFVSLAEHRKRNLRGVYVRVTGAGVVRVGDPVQVLRRSIGG